MENVQKKEAFFMSSLKRCGTKELVELQTLWVTTPQSLKTNTWRAEVGEGAEGHYSHLEAACACHIVP